jgi:phospholipid/cholesterol/gamma-HCH transport system substrate-binding protein
MSEKTERRNAKLGFFVLISLVLFLVAIFFIGGARDMFNPTFEIHTKFKDVSGLTRGNNVWLSGVKIGTVRKVEIVSDSIVAVTLRIRENDRRFINKDAQASIDSEGLIGNTIVVIDPGRMRVPVEEGDTIAAATVTSTQDIMNTLQTTGENVLVITQDIQRITRQINEGEGTIGRLLNSPELANNLEGAMQNLETTSQRSARVSRDLSQMVNKLQNNEEGPVHTLMNDTAFARVYDSLLVNIQTTGQNMNEISAELERLSNRMTNEENALNVVLSDSTFANDLQRTMNNAAEATEKLDQNMEALQQHWLFRGFFRRRNK